MSFRFKINLFPEQIIPELINNQLIRFISLPFGEVGEA